jgi:putative hydrolase of HD superfamily
MMRGVTTLRWNNLPRIEEFTILDNIGLRLHIALLLASIEISRGNKVNEELILKKILFSTFPKLILSDISYEFKKYITEIDPNIMNEVTRKVFDFLFSFDFTPEIKEDIQATVDTNSELEDRIVKTSRLYASYLETTYNASVFEYDYRDSMKALNNAILQEKKNYKAFKELFEDNNHHEYLLIIRRLVHAKRWNQNKRKYPISVMAHLVIVAFIGYILQIIEKANGKDFDLTLVLKRGLFHDIPESITGDIITPTKRIVPHFKAILVEAEERMLEKNFFPIIPEVARKEFSTLMTDESSPESKLVKYADDLCMLLETLMEINAGDDIFRGRYDAVKSKLNGIESKSVDFFIKHVPDRFADNIDSVFALNS